MTETEVKIPVASTAVGSFRARLRQAGFRPVRSRRLESNWIFDDARGHLLAAGTLLRLRSTGKLWKLTFKGPRQPGAFKRRSEFEVEVSGGATCRQILNSLGYREVLRYDRFRTTFEAPSIKGEVALDQTPFGFFVELEGSGAWIRRTARLLQLDLKQAEPRSYPELYSLHRRRH